jgi:hypothetical protein
LLHGSKDGVGLIRDERLRQPTLGWTKEHDQEHGNGELVAAALCHVVSMYPQMKCQPPPWPWEYDKNPLLMGSARQPSALILHLKKAGALIAAEIDRLLPLVKPILAADIREAVKSLEKENTLGGTRKRWYHTEPAIDDVLTIHRYALTPDPKDWDEAKAPTLCGKLIAGMEDYHGFKFGTRGEDLGDRRQRIVSQCVQAPGKKISDFACQFCLRVEQEDGSPENAPPKREQG